MSDSLYVHLQVFVRAVSMFLNWLVPDVPETVQNQIKREMYLANEALYTQARSRSPTPPKERHSPTPPKGSAAEVIDSSEL